MAKKTTVGYCEYHGEFFMDDPDSECPSCQDEDAEQICPDCGSENVHVGYDDLYECYDCEIFYDHTHPDVIEDQERIRAGMRPIHSINSIAEPEEERDSGDQDTTTD